MYFYIGFIFGLVSKNMTDFSSIVLKFDVKSPKINLCIFFLPPYKVTPKLILQRFYVNF